ncbi:TPA: hypothetical protein RQN22_001821 [Aeromonas dhakensis]|nr:hypothetical protein [Aeromonas dhakensis]
MTANKTSFNSQTAVIAAQKGAEKRRENKRLKDIYRHALAKKANELVEQFMSGANEMLGVKVPMDMRARIVEDVLKQVTSTALVTAIKQDSDLEMLEARAYAKALEARPVESEDGEYMTTSELMQREGTQTEAASTSEADEDELMFGDWYNTLSKKKQKEIMLDCFNDSQEDFFNYFGMPAKDVIKHFHLEA